MLNIPAIDVLVVGRKREGICSPSVSDEAYRTRRKIRSDDGRIHGFRCAGAIFCDQRSRREKCLHKHCKV